MDSEPGYLRIATEEAFAPPELITLWRAMLADGTCDDVHEEAQARVRFRRQQLDVPEVRHLVQRRPCGRRVR